MNTRSTSVVVLLALACGSNGSEPVRIGNYQRGDLVSSQLFRMINDAVIASN